MNLLLAPVFTPTAWLKPLISFAFLLTLKYEVFSFSTSCLVYYTYTLLINTHIIFFESDGLPPFIAYFGTLTASIPIMITHIFGPELGLVFSVLSLAVFVGSSVATMANPSTAPLGLSLQSHSNLLVVAIFQQLLPVYLLMITYQEKFVYDSLLLRFLRQAEERSEGKTAFISRLSHELRTPVHGLLSTTQLLRSTPLTADQETLVTSTVACGAMLASLVEKILEMTRIESGCFEPQNVQFSLFDLVQDVAGAAALSIRSVHHFAADLEIIVDFRLLPGGYDVMGSEPHLREVLVSILDNAIKFTDRGAITVRVTRPSPADKNNFFHFEVEDTGCGVPADQLRRIFEPFVQGAVGYRKPEGFGLGLTISRMLVEALGGTITLSSDLGRGTRVAIDLPLASLVPGAIHPPLDRLVFESPGSPVSPAAVSAADCFPPFIFISHTRSTKSLWGYFATWGLNVLEVATEASEIDEAVVVDTVYGSEERPVAALARRVVAQAIEASVFMFVVDSHLPLLIELVLVLNRLTLERGVASSLLYLSPKIQAGLALSAAEDLRPRNPVFVLAKPCSPLELSRALRCLLGYETSPGILRLPPPNEYSRSLSQSSPLTGKIPPIATSPLFAPVSPTERQESFGGGGGGGGVQVMVVEDNAVCQMVMQKQLERLGVSFHITPSGEEGLLVWQEGVRKNRPVDLIFLDVEIEGPFDGFETAARIREGERKWRTTMAGQQGVHAPVIRNSVIIVMTGRSLEEDRRTSFAVGCDEFLTKPVTPLKIQELVRKYVTVS